MAKYSKSICLVIEIAFFKKLNKIKIMWGKLSFSKMNNKIFLKARQLRICIEETRQGCPIDQIPLSNAAPPLDQAKLA